jgi:geranylgeranyl pyrophosphate synthase
LILPSKSIDYARDRARRFVDQARSGIADLPDSDARRTLDTMAQFVISRPM